MPTQLQLDGPDLEVLLARVRTELGPTARILSAEKVRSGGVAGFFARERYEITVEADDADDPAPAPSATPVTTIPRSLMDLADEVSANERSAALSTETAGFADVLRSLIRDAEPAAAVELPRPRQPELVAALDAVAAGSASAAPRVSTPRPMPSAVAWTPTTLDLSPADAVVDQAPAGHPTAVSEPMPAAASPVEPVAPPAAVLQPDTAAPTPVAAVSQPAAAPQPFAPDPAGQHDALTRLGLPAHLLPATDGYPELVERLHALPKAPRIVNGAGEVLAVVGPGHLALEFARQAAEELGLNPATAVCLAGQPAAEPVPAGQTLADAADAAQRRAEWRRRSHLTFVVVDAPFTAAGAAHAAAYLEAVQPRSTWAVVEASRKPSDVGAWAGSMGGVDALALAELESTLDPAAVLALGIPVGRLGRQPATAAAWASLLRARATA